MFVHVGILIKSADRNNNSIGQRAARFRRQFGNEGADTREYRDPDDLRHMLGVYVPRPAVT